MQIHKVQQGSPEWLQLRHTHIGASEAPAMMGVSAHTARNELLHAKHTGISPDVDAGTQRRFDDGHRFEALARPLAEEIIDEYLYPVTGSKGQLLASFDGLTIDHATAWEHKTLNNELRSVMTDGCTGKDLPKKYQVQMQQQCIVSGCSRVLFTASEWDKNDQLIEIHHCWYDSDPDLAGQIVAAEKQFWLDLADYVPPAFEAPKPTGKAPETLPALHIEVTGAVTASNLAEFKETALTAIRSVNRELTTDQDFADAEKSVKWCEDVETRLKAAKEHALSQTASIDALFKAMDEISAEARRVRLDLDKLVKARKEAIKGEIVAGGVAALTEHKAKLKAKLGGLDVPVLADFGGCIKGKRSIDSIRDAVDTELARCKIAANELADVIEANIKTLKTEADDWGFLFPDLSAVASKPAEDFANLLAARVAKYKQDQEDARRRAVQLEEERVAREAAAKTTAEQAEANRLERERQAEQRENERQAELAAAVLLTRQREASASAATDSAERIKLGDINARLAPVALTADGLAQLGFVHVATDKSAKLYRESDFPAICNALIKHITAASQPVAA